MTPNPINPVRSSWNCDARRNKILMNDGSAGTINAFRCARIVARNLRFIGFERMREQADDSVAKLLISSQFEPMNPSDRMHITMVKKLLEGGRACDKCLQAEQLLRD